MPVDNYARDLAAGARSYLPSVISSGQWKPMSGLPRLRLTGTGTVSFDARNSLGTITTGVLSYTVTSATNQIEFPYFGDDAVAVRATLTGTATVEII